MDGLAVNALVPLASVLLGAALTYWLNVRTRRRTYVEELFNQAITAVAVADASAHYLRGFSQPPSMTDPEYRQMLSQIEREAIQKHAVRAGEAREALGRVLQYEPAVRSYYQDAEAILNQPQEIITMLSTARDRKPRRTRKSAAMPSTGWPSVQQRSTAADATSANPNRSSHAA